MKRSPIALAALVLFAGCGDPVGKSWLVERTRVLGARTSAEAEPSRASLTSGERARVTWLVAGPRGTPRLSWTFAVCVAPEGNMAAPRCDGAVLASGSGVSDGAPEVPMPFVLPNDVDLVPEGATLIALAAFCETPEVSLDPRTFNATCPGGGEALLASSTIRRARAGRNANPDIADDAIRFDGAVLPPTTSARADAACTGSPGAPMVVAGGSTHDLVLHLRGAEREAIDGQTAESLLVSHVVTAGELDRQYSAVEPRDAMPREIHVPWTAPPATEIAPEGRVVEVFFVLRDGRGGTGYSRRTLCVKRPT